MKVYDPTEITEEEFKELTEDTNKSPIQKEEGAEVLSLAIDSYNKKPTSFKIPEIKWEIIARNVIRNKNTLVVGPSGCGKTTAAIEIAKSLNRPTYIFNFGSTQDPRSALIGQNQYSVEKGTFFKESDFIKALETKDCVIILDELSRAHPEAFNIILPLLDFRQTMRIEETNREFKIAEGVSFIATANIGLEYTSTRTMDRALIDRFIPIEIDFISKDAEADLISNMFADLKAKDANDIVNFAELIRKELASESSRLTTHVSTRAIIEIASLCNDGFSLFDAVCYTVLPNFDKDGGVDSERSFVMQALQKFIDIDKAADSTTKK